MTLWHGRLGGGTADVVMDYSVSLHYDRRLAVDDLAGSRAHVRGLGRGGLLADDEVAVLLAALDQVGGELATGTFVFAADDEDIHTAVERRVTEIAGDVGAKLHTGRSRNDQVATDLRLYAKRELTAVAAEILALQDVLLTRARGGRRRLPARATPTCSGPSRCCWPTICWPTAGPWPATSTACWPPSSGSTCRRSGPAPWPARPCPSTPTAWPRTWGSPPGSRTRSTPCPTGTSWPRPCSTWPSSASTCPGSGRSWCCGRPRSSGSPCSTTPTPPAARCSPRRRTPTWPSWPGARRGRLVGNLTGLLVTLKGLPLAYNRDLQEDKEPLFDSVDQTHLALAALAGVFATVSFDTDRMQEAADGSAVAAVDLAEWLVEQGMPFRQAHAVVGGLVRDSIERHVPLAELVEAHPALGEPRPWRCSSRGWPSPAARPLAGPDPRRWPSSWSASPSGRRTAGSDSPGWGDRPSEVRGVTGGHRVGGGVGPGGLRV